MNHKRIDALEDRVSKLESELEKLECGLQHRICSGVERAIQNKVTIVVQKEEMKDKRVYTARVIENILNKLCGDDDEV